MVVSTTVIEANRTRVSENYPTIFTVHALAYIVKCTWYDWSKVAMKFSQKKEWRMTGRDLSMSLC